MHDQSMTPPELIARSREIDVKATPGPWSVDHHQPGGRYSALTVQDADESPLLKMWDEHPSDLANAELIAESRTLLPALATALEEALATSERRRQERADALNVTSRDGLLSSEWVARTGAAERERDAAIARAEKAEKELATAREWTDEDRPLPEDAAIRAAHPLQTGRHDLYDTARRLVGAKRSKYALIDLVNWALSKRGNRD